MELTDDRLTPAARGLESLHLCGLWHQPDHAVTLLGREATGPRTGDRQTDIRPRAARSVELGVFDGEELTLVVDVFSGQQRTDDVHGLGDHAATYAGTGPGFAGDVLVDPLAFPETEHEPAGRHGRDRGSGLRKQDGVDAVDRRGHPGAERDAGGCMGRGAQNRPDERGLALRRNPRMEVVAREREAETGLLGSDRVANQGFGSVLLTGQPVSQFHASPCLSAELGAMYQPDE